LRTFAHPGYAGDRPNSRLPTIAATVQAGTVLTGTTEPLSHGGMDRLFTGVRAPATLGTFLRTFTSGHVRLLDAVAKNAPLLPGANQGCYIDIDDTIKATHGYAKQGAG